MRNGIIWFTGRENGASLLGSLRWDWLVAGSS
jgi:hypothetical protein